ncbi:MAG: hypothetical protein OXR82_20000 [Gammaproteobacteria bacterium]|nr:hypothetical protein [Gammaproteobacteria bacterium]MDE0260656.1 hypothetical protein [Gammaproteobacteria bacterium]
MEDFDQRLEQLRTETNQAQSVIDRYDEALDAYETAKKELAAAQGYLEAYMVFDRVPEVEDGTRRSAIISILFDDSQKTFTNAEIVRLLQEQGTSASEATLNSSVSRILSALSKQGIVIRHGPGKWQFHPEQRYGPRLL